MEATWIHEQDLFHWSQDDHLIDYFRFHATKLQQERPHGMDFKPLPYDPELDFPTWISQSQEIMQQKMLNVLASRAVSVPVNQCIWRIRSSLKGPVLPQQVEQTRQALVTGCPIVAFGCLENHQQKEYSFPVLLIRNDLLSEFLPDVESSIAPPPPSTQEHERKGDPGYSVVDVRFARLHLNPESSCLVRRPQNRFYELTVAFQSRVLARLFPDWPQSRRAYILGRGWKMGKEQGDHCLAKIAQVYLSDPQLQSDLEQGCQWIRQVREATDWTLAPQPNHPLLWPNMKAAASSYVWSHVKKSLAQKLSEITLVWRLTPDHRRECHKRRRWRWQDVPAEVDWLQRELHVPVKRARTMATILTANQKPPVAPETGVLPWPLAPQQPFVWETTTPPCIDIALDFETVSCAFEDFGQWPRMNDQTTVAMIGCAYWRAPHQIEYEKWIVNRLGVLEDELTIFQKLVEWIRQRQPQGRPRIWHWSHAESSFLQVATQRLNLVEHKMDLLHDMEWCDLRQVWACQSAGVTGAFNYSLKSVAKALYELGHIQSHWPEGQIDSGLSAMVALVRIHQRAVEFNVPMSMAHDFVDELVAYNKVDVVSMLEILQFLRQGQNNATITESKDGS